jgi:RNA polymerase-binding transcription factor DksA
MGAKTTASTGTGSGSQLPDSAVEHLRAQLELDLERQTSALAARRVAFASDACRATPLACARAAVDLYRTRRRIEDIEEALSRIESGHYGSCQMCEQPLPVVQLDMIPQARFCAACSPASSSRAGLGAGPRLGSDCDPPHLGPWSS